MTINGMSESIKKILKDYYNKGYKIIDLGGKDD